jgi:hypothetical protein
MAVVQGVREKIHLPIYDCLRVKPEEQLKKEERSGTIKFFVDVQGKTKLETNLQSASLLPHYNTFEARAMRVVISDLPPAFSKEKTITLEELEIKATPTTSVTATVELSISRAMELLEEARDDDDGEATLEPDDEDITAPDPMPAGSEGVLITVGDLVDQLEESPDGPSPEQLYPDDRGGGFIGKLVYNSVVALYVGEKVMIEVPTWAVPSGGGPVSHSGNVITNGEASPTATFRFAEPIYIDKQQNFRVELEIPDTDVLKEIQKTYGPLFIWVLLDGYMTRDVQ